MKGLTEINPKKDLKKNVESPDVEVISSGKSFEAKEYSFEKLVNVAADNFPRILTIVENIVELEKMQIQSDAVIAQMREQRKLLLTETDAYVKKKNADTHAVVEKMKIVRDMMNDYYKNGGSANVTSEGFCKIISKVVESMRDMSND